MTQEKKRTPPHVETITVKTSLGDKKVTAYVFGAWAAHRPVNGRGWTVSHVRSGMCVPPFYTEDMSRVHACRAARMLSERLGDIDPFQPVDENGVSEIGKLIGDMLWKIGLGGEP